MIKRNGSLKRAMVVGGWPLAALVCGAAAAGTDDSQLQEIVVSATRMGAQDLQQVPIAITAIDADTLNRTGLQSLADISRNVPGIGIQELGGGRNTIVMRGITTNGNQDLSDVETQPTVSVYIDDTPISLAGATPEIRVFDLDRVEVVRGPQGTVYGAGAMAGNIRYVTRKPNSSAFDASLTGTGVETKGAGGYNIRGMLNQPLVSNTLGLRLSVYQGREPGYIDNVRSAVAPNGVVYKGDGQKNANWEDDTQIRAALRLENQGPFVVDVSYLYVRTKANDQNNAYAELGDRWRSDFPSPYEDHFGLMNATVNYTADAFDVISSTSYMDRKNDVNASAEDLAARFFGLDTTGFGITKNHLEDFSQELRLALKEWRHFKGQFGVFFEHQNRNYYQDIPEAGVDAVGADSLGLGAFHANDIFSETQHSSTRQVAFFGDVTWTPIDRLDLTAGLRHFHWRQSFSLYAGGAFGASQGVPVTTTGSATADGNNPRFNATFHVADDLMVFAEAAKGFRYGGINQPSPVSVCGADLAAQGLSSAPVAFGPDHLWTYSLGEKSTLLDHRVTINTTAFLTNWSDIQTNHTLPGCGYFFEQNKGQVRSTGVELEARWQATPALSLGLNAGYTHAVTTGAITDLRAPSGASVPYFPKFIGSVDSSYTWQTSLGSLLAQADYGYRSDTGTQFSTTRSDYRVIPAYGVLNASLTLKQEKTDWSIYGRNLTDRRIVSVISPNTYGAVKPGDIVFLGRPITFGLQLTRRFD